MACDRAEARSILKMIWHRKHTWFGHVRRHDKLLHDIIEGKMFGKATWSRKRMELLYNMMEVRLWTVQRFNLRQITMETGLQV